MNDVARKVILKIDPKHFLDSPFIDLKIAHQLHDRFLADVVVLGHAIADVRGGTGANFVVDWAATGEIAEPAVEALMVGSVGPGHYTFISQGRPIRLVGKN